MSEILFPGDVKIKQVFFGNQLGSIMWSFTPKQQQFLAPKVDQRKITAALHTLVLPGKSVNVSRLLQDLAHARHLLLGEAERGDGGRRRRGRRGHRGRRRSGGPIGCTVDLRDGRLEAVGGGCGDGGGGGRVAVERRVVEGGEAGGGRGAVLRGRRQGEGGRAEGVHQAGGGRRRGGRRRRRGRHGAAAAALRMLLLLERGRVGAGGLRVVGRRAGGTVLGHDFFAVSSLFLLFGCATNKQQHETKLIITAAAKAAPSPMCVTILD